MIARYTSSDMAAVWSDEAKYQTWAEVEIAVMRAQGRHGVVASDLWKALKLTLVPTPAQVAAQEEILKHDLMAFLEAWRLNTDNREIHRWLHYGLTSSDIVETGQATLLAEANWLISNAGYRLLDSLIDHAFKYKNTKRSGRTHGQSPNPQLGAIG